MPAGDITEKSSLSNYAVARVRHVALTYVVDFEAKVLQGKADYTVQLLDDAAEVVFDTKDLDIVSASAAGGCELRRVRVVRLAPRAPLASRGVHAEEGRAVSSLTRDSPPFLQASTWHGASTRRWSPLAERCACRCRA